LPGRQLRQVDLGARQPGVGERRDLAQGNNRARGVCDRQLDAGVVRADEDPGAVAEHRETSRFWKRPHREPEAVEAAGVYPVAGRRAFVLLRGFGCRQCAAIDGHIVKLPSPVGGLVGRGILSRRVPHDRAQQEVLAGIDARGLGLLRGHEAAIEVQGHRGAVERADHVRPALHLHGRLEVVASPGDVEPQATVLVHGEPVALEVLAHDHRLTLGHGLRPDPGTKAEGLSEVQCRRIAAVDEVVLPVEAEAEAVATGDASGSGNCGLQSIGAGVGSGIARGLIEAPGRNEPGLLAVALYGEGCQQRTDRGEAEHGGWPPVAWR